VRRQVAVRDLERKVVRQFHAATEEQLKRLERRVAKLERTLDSRDQKVANVG
jgi:ribosome-interacting GTPase 1